MPSVIVAGGGLAGLSAAAALASAGFAVQVFESRPFLGGRATSFPLDSELIDNCQHVLLRCCVNLLDFYRRLGVSDRIRFYPEFYFIEPGGRVSPMRRGLSSFLRLKFLRAADKLAVSRGLVALTRERSSRQDLERISMLDWLLQKRQTPRSIERFWGQVLVSAVNETLDRMAAAHGFQVFWQGFLAHAGACDMGIPTVPLRDLYAAESWQRLGSVAIHTRSPVERIGDGGVLVAGRWHQADHYICALPFERLDSVGLARPPLEHSPITGIHLWFDRPVTDLPHATLLDRTIQWMFNKQDGRYLLLVVSASRDLVNMGRSDILAIATGELREFFPAARAAQLEKAHVIKELRATFSARPETEALRPPSGSRLGNIFLAGDWTRSGWPATMEGAVRSGYRAAEAVAAAAGTPLTFLLPDLG